MRITGRRKKKMSSGIPGVLKDERKEKEKQEMEEKKIEAEEKEHKNRIYLNELNLNEKKSEVENKEAPARIDIEQLKDKKILFEKQVLLEREIGIIAKDVEFLKTQVKDLMEILGEALNMIESEEERNKKIEEVIDKEPKEEKPVKEKIKEYQEKELQKVSLFKRA